MSVYKDKKTGKWRTDFRRKRPGFKPYRDTASFDTKAAAERYYRDLAKAYDEALEADMMLPDSTTLAQVLELVLPELEKERAASAIPSLRLRFAFWHRSPFGVMPLKEIKRRQIKEWIRKRREKDGVSDSTLRNDLSILQSVYKYVERELEWHIHNPMPAILKELGGSKKRSRRLSEQEYMLLTKTFAAFDDAYEQRDRTKMHMNQVLEVYLPNGNVLEVGYTKNLIYVQAAFQMAIESALRRAKLFSIRWEHINFNTQLININLSQKEKHVYPTVPMSPVLVKILHQLRQRTQAKDGDPIFGKLSADRAYRYLKRACNALDIQDFSWHDLRHEACSRLADAGWTTLQIQRLSGHRTLQSLERYTHVQEKTVMDLFNTKPSVILPKNPSSYK